MRIECLPEKTVRARPRLVWARSAAALALLCVLGAFGLGGGGIFAPLRRETTILTLSGIVNAAPRGAPLAGASVASDRDLCLTDAGGFFRLRASRGAPVLIRAPGYEPLRLAASGEQPRFVLLFPEAPAREEETTGSEN